MYAACLPVLLPLFHSIHGVSRIPLHDELQLLLSLPGRVHDPSIHPMMMHQKMTDSSRARDQAILDVLGLGKFVHCLGTILWKLS